MPIYCFGFQSLPRTMPVLLSRVTEFNTDNATRIDWKQVDLSDFVFSQKLRLWRWWSPFWHCQISNNTTSQPHRRAKIGRRQSFVLLVQQNHNGLNYRRSSVSSKVINTNLISHCENHPFIPKFLGNPLKMFAPLVRSSTYKILRHNVG